MHCQFQPHPDTPGRFVCERCGIPSSRNKTYYGPGGPLNRRCPEPVELPPLRDQARNFITAMASFAANGFHLTDRHERDRRIEACIVCDLFVRGRCSKCGCYGALKALGKIWTCPEGKW